MNKAELVEAIAASADITKKEAGLVLTVTLDEIIQSVAGGNKVTLVGFGSFEPKKQSAREGRNPATGEAIAIPARTAPKFHAGKEFRERVANA
jgi:DNA-binding protein HU-beta